MSIALIYPDWDLVGTKKNDVYVVHAGQFRNVLPSAANAPNVKATSRQEIDRLILKASLARKRKDKPSLG
jgi:hypothetical protein